ncbi:MAG: hypothetical protein J07HB67_01947 [halophilic archaeon J07HB67]|jgi:hypothetical protein|nr:MAG: hypothetical protein J07HB67_01947 [halophilic archaeon J07HB67]
MSDTDGGVPLWWILVFLLLTLGGGAYVVRAVGGSLLATVLPVAI